MNTVSPPTDLGANLMQRAQTLLDLGRPQDAIPVLLEALALAPGDHKALCLMALAQGRTGRVGEAVGWADRAVQAAPDHEWGHRLRANHLLDQGQIAPALRAAEEAARLGPEYPESLHTLARCQLRAGRRRDAAATAQRMRTLAPNSYLTHEMLTLIALRNEQWRGAEEHARRALAIRPNAYHALNNLGLALLHGANPLAPRVHPARLAEAMECFTRAVQISPADRPARANLTLALSRFLLIQPILLLCAFTVGIASHAGSLAGPDGLAFCLIALPCAVITTWIVLGARRYRSLSAPLRAWCRRECGAFVRGRRPT